MPASLKSRLPGVIAELQPRVSNAVKKGAEQIAADARTNLQAGGHNRTGELINKITAEREGPAEYRVVAGDNDAFYAHFLEHGTDHSPAYPFLMPAAEANRDEIAADIQDVLRSL